MFWLGCRNCIQVPSAPGPLPSRNSAPKFERIKTNFPNTRWLRTSHGARQAAKTTDASTTPANEFFPRFERRYQAHTPDAGKNASREVLVRALTPHSKPNPSQGLQP